MKKEKEKGKKKKKIIIYIALLLIILYVFYTVFLLTVQSTKLFTVEQGKIYLEETLNGYIIRDETVVKGENYKNGMEQIKSEGEKVAKNENIFRYYSKNEENLKKQIAEYQQKIDYKLPWTSAKIEGVQGTQPLLFTVIGIKSTNTSEAEKFMNHVGVLGDGTIYVELDVNVIPGNYTVSLQIENEGRTKILNDMFTFVVDAPIQETLTEE